MNKQKFETPKMESDSIAVLSKQLIEANKRLEEADRERTEMLANISHDLRAPITAIRSAIDVLSSVDTLSETEKSTALHLIDTRTRNLEHLIQDMYLLFSVEDKNKELLTTEIAAAPFLEEYYYNLLADSTYDNRELQLDIPENLNTTINIDIEKIIRVLDNLFTNARKYSTDGAKITLQAKETTDNFLVISVIDTGIGIPAASLTHVFDRTYTVSNARTPGSATGSGLGLSIVKKIAEKHGGKVSCESKEGAGSTFTVYLPTPSCSQS